MFVLLFEILFGHEGALEDADHDLLVVILDYFEDLVEVGAGLHEGLHGAGEYLGGVGLVLVQLVTVQNVGSKLELYKKPTSSSRASWG